jgi:hypothetical protein
MPLAVAVDALLEIANELRPLRPRADDAHLAAHDVEELWQLVDGSLAQERTDACPAIFSFHAPWRFESR